MYVYLFIYIINVTVNDVYCVMANAYVCRVLSSAID